MSDYKVKATCQSLPIPFISITCQSAATAFYSDFKVRVTLLWVPRVLLKGIALDSGVKLRYLTALVNCTPGDMHNLVEALSL